MSVESSLKPSRKPCSVCTHPDRAEINKGLVARRSRRLLAAEFHVSRTTINFHALHCFREAIVEAERVRVADDATAATSLLTRVRGNVGDLGKVFDAVTTAMALVADMGEGNEEAAQKLKRYPSSWLQPKQLSDLATAIRGLLELEGKLTGEIASNPAVQIVLSSPEAGAWVEMVARHFVGVLEPSPEQLAEVKRRIEAERSAAVSVLPSSRGRKMLSA